MVRTPSFFKLSLSVSKVILCSAMVFSQAYANDEGLFDFTMFLPNSKKASSSSETMNPQETTKKKNEAGTNTVCKSCPPLIPAAVEASKLKELAEQAAKAGSAPAAKSSKKKRASQIVQPYQEPTYEGPNADAEIWKQFPEIAAYSDSDEIKKVIQIAKSRMKRASIGLCYKYVKDALYNAAVKLTSRRLVGTRVFPNRKKWRGDVGVGAVETFENEGFVNLMSDPKTKHLIKNPASAPKGAILIYKGGNKSGHIEIKTDYGTRGGYVSDFMNSESIFQNELRGRTSARYELVGVMVKPMKKAL